MRTGKIGLSAFLYYRKVPGYGSPICICGNGPQTPEHLFTNCTDPRSHSLIAMGYTSISEVRAGLSSPEKAGKMAKSLLRSGWLREFRLSEKLRSEKGLAGGVSGWETKPPPLKGIKGVENASQPYK